MDQETLRATQRAEFGSRSTRRLRRSGQIPAVVYGKDQGTVSVSVDAHHLYTVTHTEAGFNALINVEVDGGDTVLAVARELQRDPVRGDITHLDFIKVSLDVAIEAQVTLEYIGVPEGVREEGGFVEAIEGTVTVEALPTDIPTKIDVNIEALRIGDTLKVIDLSIIEGVTYIDDADRPLVTVLAPRVEEEPEVEEIEGEEIEFDEDGEPIPVVVEEGEEAAEEGS